MANYNGPHTRTQSLVVGGVDVTDKLISMTSELTTLEVTTSGFINEKANFIELNHATVAANAVIPDITVFCDCMITFTNTSPSGTAAHTVYLQSGATFDGTNDTITLNAPGESVSIRFKPTGHGVVISNIGGVVFSTA